jgi:hypothetical protein
VLTALFLLSLSPSLLAGSFTSASSGGGYRDIFLSLVLAGSALYTAYRLNGHRRLLSPLLLFVLFTLGMLYLGSLIILLGYHRVFVVRLSPALLVIGESLLMTCIGACLVEEFGQGTVGEHAVRYLARPVEDMRDTGLFFIWMTGYTIAAFIFAPGMFLAHGFAWQTSLVHNYAEMRPTTTGITPDSLLIAAALVLFPIAALFRNAAALCSRERQDVRVALLSSGAAIGVSVLAADRNVALDFMFFTLILALLLGRADVLRPRRLLPPVALGAVIFVLVPLLRDPLLRHSAAAGGRVIGKLFFTVADRVLVSEAEALTFQVNHVGKDYPYFGGATYADQLLTVIHMGKPSPLPHWLPLHSRVGGYSKPGDVPFLPPTFIGEAYANFGLLGMLLLSFIMGCTLQWYWRRLMRAPRRIDRLIFASIVIEYLARSSILGMFAFLHNFEFAAIVVLGPRWVQQFGSAITRMLALRAGHAMHVAGEPEELGAR